MKIAINGQQLSATYPLPRLLDLVEGFGVKAVELWPANLDGGGGSLEQNQGFENRDVAGVARLLRTRGFSVACVTLDGGACPLGFAVGGAARYSQALKGAVDAAVQLGAPIVNTYSSGIPLPLWSKAAAPAAAYAAEHGIVITLENEAHDDSGLPENVAAVVASVGSSGLGTQYDPCNYYHAHVEPFPAAYGAIRDHIRYVHLKGGCRYETEAPQVFKGSPMREDPHAHIGYLPLPDAAFNVEAIVRALRRDGYRGWITLEPHVPAAAIPGFYGIEVPYLKKLLAE